MSKLSKNLIVYLPDTRAVEVSPYGCGNLKIGPGVFTYSRLPGRNGGTCPGSTVKCERVCYAKRIEGIVHEIHGGNSLTDEVPPIPNECQILRLHVSGDFDTVGYIRNWVTRMTERPDVTMWAYTRSWRVPELLRELEVLRALPNVQLLASMDDSHEDVPPTGWRRAWIDGDKRAGTPLNLLAHHNESERLRNRNFATFDGAMTYICPEETKHKKDCLSCGYCFEGRRNDVTFLEH